MNKKTFLETMKFSRSDLEATLALIDESQMTQPGAIGEMSIKDVIAHITWFEREMVGVLEQRALLGSDLWNLPTDERNAAILQQNWDRSLPDIRQEAQQVFQQLVEAVETLDEDELNNPSRFSEMPADWIPCQVLAGNTFEHYEHHALDLRNWLGKNRAGS